MTAFGHRHTQTDLYVDPKTFPQTCRIYLRDTGRLWWTADEKAC